MVSQKSREIYNEEDLAKEQDNSVGRFLDITHVDPDAIPILENDTLPGLAAREGSAFVVNNIDWGPEREEGEDNDGREPVAEAEKQTDTAAPWREIFSFLPLTFNSNFYLKRFFWVNQCKSSLEYLCLTKCIFRKKMIIDTNYIVNSFGLFLLLQENLKKIFLDFFAFRTYFLNGLSAGLFFLDNFSPFFFRSLHFSVQGVPLIVLNFLQGH